MSALSDIVYYRHKDDIFGVIFTKHFFERYIERFDVRVLSEIYKFLDSNICHILFDLELSGAHYLKYKVGDAILPISIVYGEIPKIKIRTIYKRGYVSVL